MCNRTTHILVFSAIPTLLPASARAQFQIDRYTSDAKRGTSAGSALPTTSTIGQPDTEAKMSESRFTLSGSFWPRVGATWRADVNGDGRMSIDDFLGYIALFAAGNLRADMTGNGSVSI